MIDPLQTALIAGSLLLAALAAVYVALDRLTDRFLLALLALLEPGLLAQAVIGIVQVAGITRGSTPWSSSATSSAPCSSCPQATFWALGEPSRARTAALVVVGLVLPVLVLRIQQVWTAPGA